MRRQTRSLPPVFGRCELAADTIDAAARTVEVVFLSGQPIARAPLFSDSYWLEFDVSPKAADLSRLNGGAPVLDSHGSYRGLGAVLGRVERAWIAGKQARATLRFSKRPEVDGVWQDVQDGILTSVSAGVFLEHLEEMQPKKGSDMLRFKVTRWQPYELSVVAVPADAGAKIQASADTERRPCRITLGGPIMRKRTKCPACKATLKHPEGEELTDCPSCEVNISDALAEQEELQRIGAVHRIREHYQLDDVWAQRHIKEQTDLYEMMADATSEKVKRSPRGPSGIGIGEEFDSPGSRCELMADGLAARARRAEPDDRARRYYDATPAEIAYEVLSWTGRHRGLDVRRNADRLVELASHTTADYPLIYANVINKNMLPEYEAATPTYRAICTPRDFRDFRPHGFLRLGDFPDLLEVNEHGEIKHGTMGESREQVTAANFARIYSITRHMLVNDDLSAFADLSSKVARRVANFENALFYTVLLANAGMGPTMADTDPLFDANHSNVGSGTIDVTNVGAGVATVMKQTGLDGVKLNLEPAILLTSPDRIAVARQFVSQNLRPTQPSEANPFANLTALADANLTAAAPWYLFTSPGAGASAIYGYIGGAAGPRVDTRAGWEVEGLEIRVSLDFAVGFIDSRGCYRSTGA